MPDKKIQWTDQQLRAIKEHDKDVFVSASAGTGKTAVLSGRCAEIVSDKNICPGIGNMLVLTFTEAAAEQMRSRIAQQLKAKLAKENNNQHLRYQLMLLPGADISTIHSFCKRLITEYFYQLGLDPTFGMIDGDEQQLLKAETLEKTMQWAWRQNHLTQAMGQLLRRRNLNINDGFLSKIIGISNFLDNVVWRQDWYERAGQLYQAANPLEASPGQKQKQIVHEKLDDILGQLHNCRQLYIKENPDGAWAQKCQETFIEPVEKCIGFLKAGNWDSFAEQIRNFKKPRVNKCNDLPEIVAELIKKTVKNAIDSFGELGELAVLNPDYLDTLGGAVSLQSRVIIELVKKFDEFYAQAKRNLNCLDFSDLEHYALRLLTTGDSDREKLKPSETALAMQNKYKYIFVDEYQDINPVQQRILDCLGAGGNVFVVGDAKQSIYAFRGAEPTIFTEALKAASVDGKAQDKGLRVDLNANFRSKKGILDFVNHVFKRIMTLSFVNIDYDESAELKCPASTEAENSDGPLVELHILDEEDRSSEQKNLYSMRKHQAVMIAQRIREMVGADSGHAQFQVFDKQLGEERDVQYRDIAILMRSPSVRVNDYIEIMRLAQVPVSCQDSSGYFEATEICDCLCLLKVLDNPQRDIELAAVLRSPFFNVTDNGLAKIKLHSKKGSQFRNFYDCLVEYSASGSDSKLAGRINEILEQLRQWRLMGRRGNLADLLWCIYRQTQFLSYVSAMTNGRQRKANLLKLHNRAIQFETFASSGGSANLNRFVAFIEKMQLSGADWAGALPATAENAVRILSIHKSKGLEFPVVFLAELNNEFSGKDSTGQCLTDVELAVGLQIIDAESNSSLSSLTHQVIAERKRSMSMAEEMRILYVATTRAKERLILTGCAKKTNCRDTILSGFYFGRDKIHSWQLRNCKKALDWILYGLADQKILHETFESGSHGSGDDGLLSVKVYGRAELERFSEDIRRMKDISRKDKLGADKTKFKQSSKKRVEKIKRTLQWHYDFDDMTTLPAKQSVSQLTHRGDEFFKFDYSKALERKPKVFESDLGGEVQSRVIGTATHLVISQLDLDGAISKNSIKKTLTELVKADAISQAVAEKINVTAINRFFDSALGQMILEADNKVHREWQFSFSIAAEKFSDNVKRAADDSVIVQGIIDMIIETDDGLVVIDFKTDKISAEQTEERAENYHSQLELYAQAAEKIFNKPIADKWLYFLTPGIEVRSRIKQSK